MFQGLARRVVTLSPQHSPHSAPLPEGWQMLRLRSVARVWASNVDKLVDDTEVSVRLCNYVDVYQNEYIHAGLAFMKGSAAVSEIKRFQVETDDVIITKDSESWEDIGVPALVVSVLPNLVCGYHLAIIRTNKNVLSGAFLHHVLCEQGATSQLRTAAGGVTRFGLTQGAIRSVSVPVPGLPEQAAIVKYLGHAHARIDRAILAKRKLITLLHEQIMAVMVEAATRGLDETVSLKSSGLDWLPEVPADWDVAALRYKYSQALGKMLDSSRISGHTSLPYLRNTDVQWGFINIDDLPVMDIPEREYARYTLEKGDLLVCEGGEVGRAAIWQDDKLVGYQKALHRLRPRDGQDPHFALLLFRVAKSLGAFDTGRVSTIAHLTGDQLRAARFAWPPPAEQSRIVAATKRRTGVLETAVSRTLREIDLLQEFRTRLTSDVMTGRVDVRGVAADLPELILSDVPGQCGDLDSERNDLLSDSVEHG